MAWCLPAHSVFRLYPQPSPSKGARACIFHVGYLPPRGQKLVLGKEWKTSSPDKAQMYIQYRHRDIQYTCAFKSSWRGRLGKKCLKRCLLGAIMIKKKKKSLEHSAKGGSLRGIGGWGSRHCCAWWPGAMMRGYSGALAPPGLSHPFWTWRPEKAQAKASNESLWLDPNTDLSLFNVSLRTSLVDLPPTWQGQRASRRGTYLLSVSSLGTPEVGTLPTAEIQTLPRIQFREPPGQDPEWNLPAALASLAPRVGWAEVFSQNETHLQVYLKIPPPKWDLKLYPWDLRGLPSHSSRRLCKWF